MSEDGHVLLKRLEPLSRIPSDTRGHSVVLFCRLEAGPISAPGVAQRQGRWTRNGYGPVSTAHQVCLEGQVARCFPGIRIEVVAAQGGLVCGNGHDRVMVMVLAVGLGCCWIMTCPDTLSWPGQRSTGHGERQTPRDWGAKGRGGYVDDSRRGREAILLGYRPPSALCVGRSSSNKRQAVCSGNATLTMFIGRACNMPCHRLVIRDSRRVPQRPFSVDQGQQSKAIRVEEEVCSEGCRNAGLGIWLDAVTEGQGHDLRCVSKKQIGASTAKHWPGVW
ncbi:hypothetical protein F5X68DRAFT_77242 [Plectosphaerella plurivora]|uniref:Uncharacterized protein n=1 Tax=Plectosphaerella plurivora TaxID=936078 RepID=A0A9P8VCT0_9PEZI|nr:hypothetical protein F5X68DRAFT_77242 [Plectosphaerella plurivora]